MVFTHEEVHGNLDVYVAGWPCQSFSTQGKRLGLKDARGCVFYSVCNVIATRKPKAFILENVPGLLSAEGGTSFQEVMRRLHELEDYSIHQNILNSKYHGVPQSRRRLYLVGIRRDIDNGTFAFPAPLPCPQLDAFRVSYLSDGRAIVAGAVTHVRT